MAARSFSSRFAIPSYALALVASVSGVSAGQGLLVRVPFDFLAGETHFGPGEYVLALEGAAAGSVTIRSAEGGRSAVVSVHPSHGTGRPTTSSVSIRAYGDNRFLAAVQVEGGRWEVALSADESALTRTHGQPKVTTLKAEASEKQ